MTLEAPVEQSIRSEVVTPSPIISPMSRDAVQETGSLPVVTLVLWAVCLGIGLLGLALPYTRPLPIAKMPEPITAEVLNVQLTNDPLPPPDPEPPAATPPPPLLEPVMPSTVPPMLAVAEPSPNIAFALPAEGPARIVEARAASYARTTAPQDSAPATPPVQPLTFGRGEGTQQAPEYPRESMRAGQEGTVVVRFSVGDDGRVLAAEASSPSPWTLLNAAAVRVVRERWRFRPGPMRLYEVAIRFELRK